MRTYLINTFPIGCLIMLLAFFACKKEDNNVSQLDYDVSFSVQLENSANSVNLKSSQVHNTIKNAHGVIITILNKNGSPTNYTSYELLIQKMNGIYYTKPILLKSGNYKITEFLVLDAADSTILVAPIKGSPQAQNVTVPLPIDFTVSKDSGTSVNVEVLSVENLTPEDFGLSYFSISEIETVSILTGVVDNKSRKLIQAEITVENPFYLFRQSLSKTFTNVVKIKSSNNIYSITYKAKGYNSYSRNYTIDNLIYHSNKSGNDPFLIPLQKSAIYLKDIDGNEYNTVKIGDQIWMAENLKTTRYSDGTPIPEVATKIGWNELKNGAYCWVYNDNKEGSYRGKLYNWYTINDKLCPVGWHVPNVKELNSLSIVLGGANIAGGALKDTINWNELNFGATNKSGFSAFPNGLRDVNGEFNYQGEINSTWLASESSSSSTNAIQWGIYFFYTSIVTGEYDKRVGASIRCMKDN
jgi:uncharacterized protein (TIGR02145 family)